MLLYSPCWNLTNFPGNRIAELRLKVDDVAQADTVIRTTLASSVGGWQFENAIWVLELGAGIHTISLQMRNAQGSNNIVIESNRRHSFTALELL